MPTRNVNLTEHDDQFVEKQVKAGHYQNASEVLRAGLRLLEQQEHTEAEKLKVLKKLAKEGFASLDRGECLVIQGEDSLHEVIRHCRNPNQLRTVRPGASMSL